LHELHQKENDEILPLTKGLRSESFMLKWLGLQIQCLSIRLPPVGKKQRNKGNAITHPHSHSILVPGTFNTALVKCYVPKFQKLPPERSKEGEQMHYSTLTH